MKLHHTLIEKLVRIYATYGGYREETRLINELKQLEVEVYNRASGEAILVDRQALDKHKGT